MLNHSKFELQIIKVPSGDHHNFKFVLSDGQHFVVGNRNIHTSRYERHRTTIESINDHIAQFLNGESNNIYRQRVNNWLIDVSKMILREFLPAQHTKFAQFMTELENKAAGGEYIYLRIITDEFLIPWWLARSYEYSMEVNFIWSSLFIVEFFPLQSIYSDIETNVTASRRKIALISRPSSDLEKATDLELRLDREEITQAIRFYDGKMGRREMGRFGLTRWEIENIFKENEVLLYYGHFNLNEDSPKDSYLEAVYEYLAGRDDEYLSDDITLESIEHFLKGKVLFLNACRSIGLPYFTSEFVDERNTLPNYYLRNQIICIGTIYPIFDTAAVEYMVPFIKFLLAGLSLGEAMKLSREPLQDSEKNFFDWASYLLIGDSTFQLGE